MIFLLVLQMWAGAVIVGQYESEDECEEAAVAYMAMLAEQRSDTKHNAKVGCAGVPRAFAEPREMREAGLAWKRANP